MVGGHATVGRLSNNLFWTFQAIRKIFWKKSLNGHAEVVGGHATVGRLSNNVFWTFQAIRKNFEKSHWTVTRMWLEVTRPSADCQITYFLRFKQLVKILKKVTERSRASGRRSRDRLQTVKEREREREREYLAGSCYLQYCVYPTIFPCVDPRSQLFRFFRESPAGLTWCYVAYVASVKASPAHTVGNRQGQLVYERVRARARARESEREREREIESETEYYVAFGRRIADEEAKIRQKNLPDNFPVCWLLPHPSRFFTRISRKRYVVLCRLGL